MIENLNLHQKCQSLFFHCCVTQQLVSGEVLLTRAENERLAELLQQIDEEEDSTRDTDIEVG